MSSKKPPAVRFVCTHCDGQFPKWQGRCESCGSWGTLKEAVPTVENETRPVMPAGKTAAFASLKKAEAHDHLSSGVAAVDRVLGGGFVAGSISLIGGEPGIGKSTLIAQAALAMAKAGGTVLYVTGEESPTQVGRRLERLANGPLPETLRFLDQTESGTIAATIASEKPSLAIVDSIQTLRASGVTGEPGNPTQVRASASIVGEAAKRGGIPLVLVGQVTKDGDLAGPRLLEHLVDTVLMLEGDRTQELRILRVLKHRFGPTEESALFTMEEGGLVELLDPSLRFLQDRGAPVSGSVASCTLDGGRPIVCEVQSLVTPAGFGIPARRIVGLDPNRVQLLIAVLTRRARCPLGDQDVFVNTVGGLRISDPATDVPVALALASALWDQPVRERTMAFGEISLSGEVRPIPRLELRLKEARRLGYTAAIVPVQPVTAPDGMEILTAPTLAKAVELAGLKPVHKASAKPRQEEAGRFFEV